MTTGGSAPADATHRTALPPPLARGARAVICLAVLAAAAACNGPETSRWDDRALEAARMRDGGDVEAATEAYRTLRDSAPSAQDRLYAQLQLARLAADRGDLDGALERYRAIWRNDVWEPTEGRAMSEAADLCARRGDRARARRLRRRLIERYPGTNWSERAAERLVDRHREAGEFDRLRNTVDELYTPVSSEPIADNLLFLVARAHAESGRDRIAAAWYRRQLRDHPDGNMADDAEWELANLYLDHRQWEPARRLLVRVADRVRISRFIGSYNSPWAADARWQLGWIHLVHLDDYARARTHFRTYLRQFPHTPRTDDAHWHLAQTFRLEGRTRRYRRALGDFLEARPDSRRSPRARRLLEGGTP